MAQLSAIPERLQAPSTSGGAPSMFMGAVQGYNDNPLLDIMSGGLFSTAAMQDKQNEYNRWLYENYQSPKAMMKQYEEAGINPNFAAQGANGSPASASSSQVQNRTLPNIVSAASALNGLLNAVSEGVSLVSDIAGVPQDIAYKKYRNILLANQGNIADSKAEREKLRAVFEQLFYGGASRDSWIENGISYNPQGSPAFRQMLLRNDVLDLTKQLRSYDLNNLKPEELRLLRNRIDQVAGMVGINQKTLDYFDSNTLVRIIASLLGVLPGVSKIF